MRPPTIRAVERAVVGGATKPTLCHDRGVLRCRTDSVASSFRSSHAWRAALACLALSACASEQEKCEDSGGQWSACLSGYYCARATSDGGKVCSDDTECEWTCDVDLTQEDQDWLSIEECSPGEEPQGDPPSCRPAGSCLERTGRCSPYRTLCGCWWWIEQGEVCDFICAD
jgi:hypothetical protein